MTAFVIYGLSTKSLMGALVALHSCTAGNSIQPIFDPLFFMRLLTPEFGLLTWSLFLSGLIFLWIIALVDILRHEFQGSNEKLIWVLVVIFMPFLGSLLYFIIGRQNRIKHNQY